MYFSLLRPQQWYKNLLIFVPLIFSLNLLNVELFFLSLQGFILLCLSSSGLYIINDILDYKNDKFHHIKKHRPIASGKISKKSALVLAIIFLVLSITFSFQLNQMFFLINVLFIFLTIIYSVRAKNVAFLDVFLISLNYVFRAVAGGYLLSLEISNWLIIGIFFFALLLSFSKRYNEIKLLNNDSISHRKSLKRYSKHILRWSIYLSSAIILITYSVYALSGSATINDWRLGITIPIAFVIIFDYSRKILSDKFPSKEFHQMLISSRSLLIEISIFIISILILIYIVPHDFFP